MKLIESIQSKDSLGASNAIMKALRSKTAAALQEARKQVAVDVFGEALDEDVTLDEASKFSDIGVGDSVTYSTPQKQQGKGRAVMKGPAGWVLNTGGKHGTTQVVHDKNYVSHRKGKKSHPDHLGNFLHGESENLGEGFNSYKRTSKGNGETRKLTGTHPDGHTYTAYEPFSGKDSDLHWHHNPKGGEETSGTGAHALKAHIDKFHSVKENFNLHRITEAETPDHPLHQHAVDAGLKHTNSTTLDNGTKLHTYMPDHHWKTGVTLKTKGTKHSWQGGGIVGGDHKDVAGMNAYIKQGVANHDSLMAHHKAGTGPFAPQSAPKKKKW